MVTEVGTCIRMTDASHGGEGPSWPQAKLGPQDELALRQTPFCIYRIASGWSARRTSSILTITAAHAGEGEVGRRAERGSQVETQSTHAAHWSPKRRFRSCVVDKARIRTGDVCALEGCIYQSRPYVQSSNSDTSHCIRRDQHCRTTCIGISCTCRQALQRRHLDSTPFYTLSMLHPLPLPSR